MKSPSLFRRFSPRLQSMCAALLLAASAFLLFMDARAVRQTRDVGLPAAVTLQSIEQHISVLKEQTDAAQLTASISGGSTEEMAQAYAVPAGTALDRLMSTLTLLFNSMQQSGQLHALPLVQVGDTVSASGSVASATDHLRSTPVRFTADVNEAGLKTLLLFSQVSGLLTVSDALSQKDIDTLIGLTEQENPTAVASLQVFLGTDLLQYAQDPGAFEDQLLRSFPSDGFAQSFHAVLAGSKLPDIASLLHGDFGQTLQKQNLWPPRFLTLAHSAVDQTGDGSFRVTLAFDAYARSQ